MNLKGPIAAVVAVCAAAALFAFNRGGESAPSSGPLPQRLSETGLFAPGSATEVRSGVFTFSPQYPLWSDGATKRRWISLPRGSFIDASKRDAWEFPPGTRFWKEFSVGRPVETRFIERLADGTWRYATYVWNEEASDAVLAPQEGMPAHTVPGGGSNGRRYPIPSEGDCRACHEGAAVPPLGFSALQLSPDRDPLAPHGEKADAAALDLRTLVARGLLRNLPEELIDTPPRIAASSPRERAALGYLHGNCGHCHTDPEASAAAVPVEVRLAQGVDAASAGRVLDSLLGASTRFRLPGTQTDLETVAPGDAAGSALAIRMRSRDPRIQMPPLGTTMPDTEALALIERWIAHDLKAPKELQQ